MGKYDELCILQQAALNRYVDYEQACYTFAENFFDSLIKYLECSETVIKYHLSASPTDIVSDCPLHQALTRQNDGFYEIYFSLTLANQESQDMILISFKLKKAADHYTIRAGLQRRDFEIAGTDDLISVYEYFYSTIKNYYEQDGYMKPTSNTIGFVV